jgi:ribosomal protein S18 acetylase RimI-like enzyme
LGWLGVKFYPKPKHTQSAQKRWKSSEIAPSKELKISVHHAKTVVLMSENGLSFQICRARGRVADDEKSIDEGWKAVVVGLNSFNEIKAHIIPYEIYVFMRDRQNKVVGGAVGYTFGDWLHVNLLWVDESFRNRGCGTKLLKMIENESVRIGCRHVDLDTLSFQARPFYEKQGYTLFATLDNYPEGHRKYFLKKDLP